MPVEQRVDPVKEEGSKASYESPKLIVLGNLRDLLAGGGSQSCDGSLNAAGPDNISC